MEEFLLQSYDYDLPSELIAAYPANPKESARLLVYERSSGKITHSDFAHLFDFIPKDSLLVFNDTKVLKARLFGHKQSGGKIEVFIHRQRGANSFLVQIKGRVKKGDEILLDDGFCASVLEVLDQGFRVVEFFKNRQRLDSYQVYEMLEGLGHTPLPPYIKRDSKESDESDYQSVFARHYGAVAAPTASLHFSDSMMARVRSDYQSVFLTLHVGAGTFMNVESEDIRLHQIHSEILRANKQTIKEIMQARKILCIGTTAMRSVEFLARRDEESAYSGECDIFLHLGNRPVKTDYLLTNFHLPKSSLLMLVSSMVGLNECKRIYREAIKQQYRFYSYGDGMLIL